MNLMLKLYISKLFHNADLYFISLLPNKFFDFPCLFLTSLFVALIYLFRNAVLHVAPLTPHPTGISAFYAECYIVRTI